MDGEISHSVF